jgi:hypothetical protein
MSSRDSTEDTQKALALHRKKTAELTGGPFTESEEPARSSSYFEDSCGTDGPDNPREDRQTASSRQPTATQGGQRSTQCSTAAATRSAATRKEVNQLKLEIEAELEKSRKAADTRRRRTEERKFRQ